MPHVFYSQTLANIHDRIWNEPNNKPNFRKSMATWERKFYTIGGEEVEGNLEADAAELPERLAAKCPDAVYRGEGVITRTQQMR